MWETKINLKHKKINKPENLESLQSLSGIELQEKEGDKVKKTYKKVDSKEHKHKKCLLTLGLNLSL